MPRPKSSHTLILEAALEGLEAHRQRLEEQIAGVRSMLGPERRPAQAATKPKRTMSAAARRRISAAQRKRWAALKKAQQGK